VRRPKEAREKAPQNPFEEKKLENGVHVPEKSQRVGGKGTSWERKVGKKSHEKRGGGPVSSGV